VRSFAYRRQLGSTSGLKICGRLTTPVPVDSVRMTPEAKPTWIHRCSSSEPSCRDRPKYPPTSEPHRLTPDRPMVRPLRTADVRPSKPQSVVGSPPHTMGAVRAAPVHPERMKRSSGRFVRCWKAHAAPW